MTTAVAARPSIVKVIAGAGLLVGTLDIARRHHLLWAQGSLRHPHPAGHRLGLIGRTSYTMGRAPLRSAFCCTSSSLQRVATIYFSPAGNFRSRVTHSIYGTLYGISGLHRHELRRASALTYRTASTSSVGAADQWRQRTHRVHRPSPRLYRPPLRLLPGSLNFSSRLYSLHRNRYHG